MTKMTIFAYNIHGEMAEWLKVAVLKTVQGNTLPGFESLSLRTFFINIQR